MSDLLTMSPADFCSATKACDEGRNWALTQPTMVEVWDNCQRPDWLLWILDAIDQRPDDRTLRLFAVWCARGTPLPDGRKTGDLLTDPRSLAALDVAERYADNNATDEELRAARDAAWAALAAARGAARDAEAAWAAAWAAAGDAAWDAQADHLRTLVPNPFKREVNK